MMKRRMLPILWLMILLALTACSGTSPKPDGAGIETGNQKPQNRQEKPKPDSKEASQEAMPEKERELKEWERAYLEYVEALEYNDSYTYSLIYVDEDEIPELVADSGFEAGGCQILTWHEGKTDVLQTSRLHFTYLEKGNLLCNSAGNMGFYYDNVYTIEDGLWSFVGGGTYGDSEDGPQFDENGDFVYEYHWLEEPVEQSEYEGKLHAIYQEEQAVTPKIYYIKDEMVSLLETGKTTSAGHRYELIVQDVTWEEAGGACRERGGYLATLTSREEFERIQSQILSEEKSAVTFFVGAANTGDSWGYAWLEPGKEIGYSMLDLYNALFADYWLEGEPSYSGLTEEGQEIKENCVTIFYRSSDGRCYLNDVPGDILSAFPSFAGRVGYICEYDE